MPWPLRQITGFDELNRIMDENGELATVGCWFYKRHEPNIGSASNGMQVVVILPPGGYRGIFQPYFEYPNKEKGPQRWSVSGEWPSVTVAPSINCPGAYHGYITNGMVTDDVDGRKF